MTPEIEHYILSHTDPESDYLHNLWREVNIRLLNGRMTCGHLEGRLLKMIVEMARPKNVLEIGTFGGYSAICLAEGLKDGGKVYTFEKNDELEEFTREKIEGSNVANKITFIIGDAISIAPKLGVIFDLAFIDGDKRTYVKAYEMTMKILKPAGFIIADNTLWDGHVIKKERKPDAMTLAIENFNNYILKDNRVECLMLPIRDGLTLIRKKENQ